MSGPAWRLHAGLDWPDPALGGARLAAGLAGLNLPAPFAERVQAEIDSAAEHTRRRAPEAAVQVRVLVSPEAAGGPHALWGFFCLERRPAAAQCVLEVFLYPER